ncbi:phage protein Gp37 [Methylomonas sp. 11b]|uniref:phage protein Gp37 n=1 Tax=Methylomonas sp. 11b TaxID=1168169 RepID=UPI00047C02B7|nr:phage protein Gp37 [Methylomonas sp. 11b]
MSIISDVEDNILSVVATTLPGKLRDSGSLPGAWSVDLLKQLLQKAPAVYVAFNGGPINDNSLCTIDARFDVYAVTKEPQEITRRRGTPAIIGAYDIIHALVPKLHLHRVPGIGTLQGKDIANLFSNVLTQLGGTVYAATFTLPKMPLLGEFSDATLGDFITFHAESDINGDGTFDFTNQFNLPQG